MAGRAGERAGDAMQRVAEKMDYCNFSRDDRFDRLIEARLTKTYSHSIYLKNLTLMCHINFEWNTDKNLSLPLGV